MESLKMMFIVVFGSVGFCGLYSALDIKYGENGYLCWSAFLLLITVLSGGPFYGAVVAALMAGGKAGGLEPFTVLVVSVFAARLIHSHFYRPPEDDLKVDRKPYEEEIRDLLFRKDPSKLHLVDAELEKFRGREKQLLREYQMRYEPPTFSGVKQGEVGVASGGGVAGGGSGGSGGSSMQKSALQLAHEEEARRVQENIDASIKRITRRIDRRRS